MALNYKLLEGFKLYQPVDKLFKFSKSKLDGRPNSSIIPNWVDFYKILEDAETQGFLNLASSNSAISYQNANNGVIVKKSGNGIITTTKTPGLITITVPDNTLILSGVISTTSSDYNSGELQIRIIGGTDLVANLDDSTMIFPSVELENRNVIISTQNYQSIDKDPADVYNIQYVRPIVSGESTTLITGLSGNMGIKFYIP